MRLSFASSFVLLLALPALAEVTFSQDAWPIIEKHCVNCHRPGEIGPMPLTSYKEVRPWARSIREAVRNGKMPPWHAAPNADVHYSNNRSLSRDEVDRLTAWVDGGAKEGAPLHPASLQTSGSQWKLGKPDWTFTLPGYPVPANGEVAYQFLIVPTNFKEDVWVEAAEFRVDQRAVIHHMNAFARAPGSSYVAGYPAGEFFVPTSAERLVAKPNERSFDRRQMVLGYEPGYEPIRWQPGEARLIKAGTDIIFEIHYTPNGKAVTDRTEFGLYFAKQPPARRLLSIQAANRTLAIPPGDPDYRSDTQVTFSAPVELISMQPHMHLRGKAMEIQAVYPDGSRKKLLDVPHYDFQWQTTYFLDQPLQLPAGTRLECVAHFDNSTNNRYNPDPNRTVHWGDQSWEEMHIGFLDVRFDASRDAETILDPASQRVDVKTEAASPR